jgi:tetratricopeptide (TPR) repeat protein
MEVDNPKDGAKMYGFVTVIALFSLAFFWSVGSSFRLIFFGAATAFGVLYFLKRGAFDFRLKDFFQQKQTTQQYNTPTSNPFTTSEKGALYFGLGTLVAVILAFAIYAVSTQFEGATANEAVQRVELNSETFSFDTNNPDDVLEQGNNFYNNSQFDSAMVYYKRALALRPGYKEAYYNIALTSYSQSDYSNAILTMKECLNSYPDYGDGLQLMGNCHSSLEQNDEALSFYERSYATGTRNAELSHYLAYLHDLKNNTARAIEFYKEALQQDSSKVDVYKRLAELEPDKAEWYSKKADAWDGNK